MLLPICKDAELVAVPVTEDMRGGFGARITTLRDHQFITEEATIFVPWDNKQLDISFATFRDKLTPGGRETWRVMVKTPSGKPAVQGAAELLAYMYDRSLDFFAPHHPPSISSLYPWRAGLDAWAVTLGTAQTALAQDYSWVTLPLYPTFRSADLVALSGYGIGGPGARGGVVGGVVTERARMMPASPQAAMKNVAMDAKSEVSDLAVEKGFGKEANKPGEGTAGQEAPVPLRSNFSETAFWQPHLLTGADGTAR